MGQDLADQGGHRATRHQAVAEVTLQEVAHPDQVLLRQGLVQAIARRDHGALFGSAAGSDQVVQRVAGGHVNDGKDQDRYDKEHGDQRQQSANGITQHDPRAPLAYSAGLVSRMAGSQ